MTLPPMRGRESLLLKPVPERVGEEIERLLLGREPEHCDRVFHALVTTSDLGSGLLIPAETPVGVTLQDDHLGNGKDADTQ